jgi:16S rRNA (cytosine967-C5)-methyltransferase
MKSTSDIVWNRLPFPRKRNLCELWTAWLQDPKLPQLDRWIAAQMKAHKEFGKADRRFYSDMLFAAARWGLPAAVSARTGASPSDRRWLDEAVKLGSPEALLAALREIDAEKFFSALAERFSSPEAPDLSFSCTLAWHGIFPCFEPDILARAELSGWDSDQRLRFVLAHESRPPLWIRPNRADAAAEISQECSRLGFSCEAAGPVLALSGDSPVYDLETKKKGLFEIQDYASAMIGVSCDVHPGMIVWDACAGGGGKTMQIAAALQGRGCVYASDIREYKLAETKLRARSAGFSNVRTLAWNGDSLPDFPKEVITRGGFHRVLVDAPCSAAGTWRRNPDAKMRVGREALAELNSLQSRILAGAARTVRKDGLLIYATCSFFPSENENIVAAFLKQNPSFELVSSQTHGSPLADADTTFTAVLRSVGASCF